MINQTLHNRYKVTARLGKGAMGEVYRATDRQTQQEVALKVIARDLALDPEMLARFRREGESLRQLRHRNIVAFGGMFDYQGQQIIVMEYVPGGDLHTLIKRGPLPAADAVRIALELSDALAQAHHINIIHRDLKPENVLMANGVVPKLTDFGVARLLSETARLTGTGALVGTPYYMSPEAWQGRPLDAQADVWSLGVVLYEMVTGRVPFLGDTLPAVMNKVLMEPPPDLRVLSPAVPEKLVRIIERALMRDQAQRYKTMRQVAVDLEEVEAESRLAQVETHRKARVEQQAGMLPAQEEARRKTGAEQPASVLPVQEEARRKAEAEQQARALRAQAEARFMATEARKTEIVAPATVRAVQKATPPGAGARRGLVIGGVVALVVVCLLAAGGLGLWAMMSQFRPTASPASTATALPSVTMLPTLAASFTPEPPANTPTLTPEPPTAVDTPVPPTATRVLPTQTPIPPTATRIPATKTPVPPTSTPTTPPAVDRGLRITGRVEWAASPVPGAQIVLKESGNYYQTPVLAETTTGADGGFVLENPPAGSFSIYAVAPTAEYWGWVGHSITIGVGQAVDAGAFQLKKKMQLLEPASGAKVTTTTPVLRWASYPGAARYHVDLFNDATGQAVMRQDTTDTSVVVAPPLAPGVRYQWSVYAYSAANLDLAYYSAWTFTVQP